jgi:hypothetical protein
VDARSGSDIPLNLIWSLPRTNATLAAEEMSITLPPHKQNYYEQAWYRHLVVLNFFQAAWLATAILSSAYSSTNTISNLLDLEDIGRLAINLLFWFAICAQLLSILWTIPFICFNSPQARAWSESTAPKSEILWIVLKTFYFGALLFFSFTTLLGRPIPIFWEDYLPPGSLIMIYTAVALILVSLGVCDNM